MADDIRLQTLIVRRESKLITETCSGCGILYAMPEEFQKERLADKRAFYCPNGHQQNYTGKSETQKLREQLDEERRQRQHAQQQIEYEAQLRRQESERADRERNRANGYKGHATRITKRAKAGVCPCCNRSFENLRRHMASRHPQFTPMEIEDRPPEGATVQ
jgi:DNA repair exonuclease SbcCD ATPase subunit